MRILMHAIRMALLAGFGVTLVHAAQLELPSQVPAGSQLTIRTSGQGSASFYLIGPGSVVKHSVTLGNDIHVDAADIHDAGRYLAILRSDSGNAERVLWVTAAQLASLSFLARPSRLPVGLADGISGVVYPFDRYNNLVLKPETVKFELSVGGTRPATQTVATRNGFAWTRASSGRKAGMAQFTASIGDVSERRVVQLVASDPCNLRIEASRVKNGVEVKTAPIRDCSGNPVPDGTIVTFTAVGPQGKSSVDARIKRGIASAEFPTREAVITVASGVVMGNEVRIGGGQ